MKQWFQRVEIYFNAPSLHNSTSWKIFQQLKALKRPTIKIGIVKSKNVEIFRNPNMKVFQWCWNIVWILELEAGFQTLDRLIDEQNNPHENVAYGSISY